MNKLLKQRNSFIKTELEFIDSNINLIENGSYEDIIKSVSNNFHLKRGGFSSIIKFNLLFTYIFYGKQGFVVDIKDDGPYTKNFYNLDKGARSYRVKITGHNNPILNVSFECLPCNVVVNILQFFCWYIGEDFIGIAKKIIDFHTEKIVFERNQLNLINGKYTQEEYIFIKKNTDIINNAQNGKKEFVDLFNLLENNKLGLKEKSSQNKLKLFINYICCGVSGFKINIQSSLRQGGNHKVHKMFNYNIKISSSNFDDLVFFEFERITVPSLLKKQIIDYITEKIGECCLTVVTDIINNLF